jgi:hypothetical protein
MFLVSQQKKKKKKEGEPGSRTNSAQPDPAPQAGIFWPVYAYHGDFKAISVHGCSTAKAS